MMIFSPVKLVMINGALEFTPLINENDESERVLITRIKFQTIVTQIDIRK